MLEDGVAQMREISASKSSVPIAAIALTAIEIESGEADLFGVKLIARSQFLFLLFQSCDVFKTG